VLDFYFQTFAIVIVVFVQLFDLLGCLYEELLWFYSLSFTGFDRSGAVEDGFCSSALIEILQTDYH